MKNNYNRNPVCNDLPCNYGGTRQKGFSLIEIMISVVILSVGLLGIAGLMVRAQNLEFESYQRGQALLLVEDLAQRILNNRANAATYVQAGAIPASGTVEAGCMGGGYAGQTDKDLCEWRNALRGAAVQTAGGAALATHLVMARGCVTAMAGETGVYIIEVVWQGRNAVVAPSTACGNTLFPDDRFRRSVSLAIRVPNLAS